MKKLLMMLFFALLLPPHLQAQILLDEYLQQAGENNPQLKARFAEYQAALERVPQVGALPDPEAAFSFFLTPMERYMGNQVGEVSVMQMFPWFGSLGAARSEAEAMARMKLAAFEEAKLTLYHEVHTNWLRIYQLEKEAELMEKEVAILKTMERLALAKYASPPAGAASPAPTNPARSNTGTSGTTGTSGNTGSGMAGMGGGGAAPATGSGSSSSGMGGAGAMTPMASVSGSMVDVILLRVQVKELENRLQLLRASKRPLVFSFNNLLRRLHGTPVQTPDTLTAAPLPPSLTLIHESIRENHPMLQMHEWDEKARESQLQMARLMGRPMIGIGLNYMVFKPRIDAMEGEMMGKNMLMPMVSVSLPIYRKKNRALQQEVRYTQEAVVLQREAAERQLFNELESLLYEYQRSTSTLDLLQEQVALNDQAIRLLTNNYAVGGASLEDVLRQRQVALGYRQQQLQALVDQNLASHGINILMNSHLYTGTHETKK